MQGYFLPLASLLKVNVFVEDLNRYFYINLMGLYVFCKVSLQEMSVGLLNFLCYNVDNVYRFLVLLSYIRWILGTICTGKEGYFGSVDF